MQDSQLLLPDLTLFTINDDDDDNLDNNRETEEKPMQMEKVCLAKLTQYTLPELHANNSRRLKVFWTMHPEEDNLDHFVIVINNSLPIGDFICALGLAPVSVDALSSLIKLRTDSSTTTTTNNN